GLCLNSHVTQAQTGDTRPGTLGRAAQPCWAAHQAFLVECCARATGGFLRISQRRTAWLLLHSHCLCPCETTNRHETIRWCSVTGAILAGGPSAADPAGPRFLPPG